LLRVSKIIARVFILNGIIESIFSWDSFVFRFMVSRSWFISWGRFVGGSRGRFVGRCRCGFVGRCRCGFVSRCRCGFVSRCRCGFVGWCGLVGRCRLISRSRCVISRCRCVISRCRDISWGGSVGGNGCRLVCWCRCGLISRLWGWMVSKGHGGKDGEGKEL